MFLAGGVGPPMTPSFSSGGWRSRRHCSNPLRPDPTPHQMGPNAKELFRLVEDFVDVIGFRMKDLRDAYQVTDNLGKPTPCPADPSTPCSETLGQALLPQFPHLCTWTGASVYRQFCVFSFTDLK